MFRHVVLFRWTDDATVDQRRAVVEGLARLPVVIPEIRSYVFGADAGVNEGNHDFAVVADFASREDYLTYRDHADHRALVARRIGPILATRAAVQFEVE